MKNRNAPLRLVREESAPESDETVDFDALFLRYAPYAARVAFRIMGSADELDDIVQDVFIEVHKSISLLRSVRHAKGWVATITVRVCAKRLHGRRLRRLLVPAWTTEVELDEFEIPKEGLSPEEQVWLKHVYAVLRDISVPLRVAWTLRYLEGERLEHVAKMCRCSLATAKRRISRAHQLIRKAVDDE